MKLNFKLRIKQEDKLNSPRIWVKSKRILQHKTTLTSRYWMTKKKGSRAKKINKRGTSDNEDEEYPGVSTQKRVKIRAEKIFVEAQAFKKAQHAATEQKRTRKAEKEEKGKVMQTNAKKSRTDT
eukprot:4821565-Heterocapsa_arctica.AAC.1